MDRENEITQPICPTCNSRLYSVPVLKSIGTIPNAKPPEKTEMLICYSCLQHIAHRPKVDSVFEIIETEKMAVTK